MKKRVLSWLLVLALILGCVPNASALVSLTDNSAVQQNELDPVTDAEKAEAETVPEDEEEDGETVELTKYESSGWEPFSETEAGKAPEDDEMVTFIVVVDEQAQLELYSADEIANLTAQVQSHAEKQEAALNAVKASVQSAFGSEAGFELGYTYTIATTGFAVKTAYGNRAAIEAMEGVRNVYVAPTFSLPENQDFEQYTNNASTMIGGQSEGFPENQYAECFLLQQ